MRNNLSKILALFLACYLLLLFYLGYLNIVLGPDLAVNPHNKRLNISEQTVWRGAIYDRKGVPLARTVEKNGYRQRVYPLGSVTGPVVGFVSERYGRTGLESAYDRYLLGMDDGQRFQAWLSRLRGNPWRGSDVVTTLDAGLQKKAQELLLGRRGAVVALVPDSGEILVLASSPSYDPSGLEEQAGETLTKYDLLAKDPSAPLLNRAAAGAYPPGSTFKLITAAGALNRFPEVAEQTFLCQGGLTVNGFNLTDNDVHGKINFTQALAVSCNAVFAGLGLELGADELYRAALSFGFNDDPWRNRPEKEVPYFGGSFPSPRKMKPEDIASTAIGQGELLASPLQMALVAAAIANDGVLMRPHLLREIHTYQGGRKKTAPEVWKTPVQPAVARIIKEGMRKAVTGGTAREAFLPGVAVAGKTGSAQNPQGAPHAWFVGFAPVDKPAIALAVLVENGGSGGTVAAPLAREIFREYFKRTG